MVSSRQEDLRQRTKRFALQTLKFVKTLPHTRETDIVTRQLLRSATSVAANYRAVQRARSLSEFAAKIGVVLEEADESQFWIEMLVEGELCQRCDALSKEARELVAIFTTSHRTVRTRLRATKAKL